MQFRHLTIHDRTIIEFLVKKNKSQAEIAKEIGVHRSTISRELKRNSTSRKKYIAKVSHRSANDRKLDIGCFNRKINGALRECIVEKTTEGWSPEQISQRLKLEKRWKISHESIYKFIHFLSPDLKRYLRRKGRRRRKNPYKRVRVRPNWEPKKLIETRPDEANQRSELGHFERDLLLGKRNGPALLVIEDRKSRLVILSKVNNKTASEVSMKTIESLKEFNVKSITNDNGTEFCNFLVTEKELNAPIYFCHPYCSQQRGSVENTNGLLRQYFPKGIDFNEISETRIKGVEDAINCRPRKIFNFKTANEVHYGVNEKNIDSYSFYYYRVVKRRNEEFNEYLRWLHS